MRQRLAAVLGDRGRVLAPENLDALAQACRELAAAPPGVIAVHGGDGAMHQALTRLLPAFGEDRLPPLAILTGGTMNVVASSLGLKAPPEAFLARLAEDVAAGRPPPTLRRRCLAVEGRYGFVFANGFMASFLQEYYAKAGYGAGRAFTVAAHTLGSAMVGGAYARQVLRRFVGRITIDGQEQPWREVMGVGAATVREVGLGFKLNHRADDDPERFGALVIFEMPNIIDLPAIQLGEGLSPKRGYSTVASKLTLEPLAGPGQGGEAGETSYTIDGDMYQMPARLELTIGPALRLCTPR